MWCHENPRQTLREVRTRVGSTAVDIRPCDGWREGWVGEREGWERWGRWGGGGRLTQTSLQAAPTWSRSLDLIVIGPMQRLRSTHEPRCCETAGALEPLSLFLILLPLPTPTLTPNPTPLPVPASSLLTVSPPSPPLSSPSPDGSSSAEKTHFLMSLLNQNPAPLQTDVVRGPCMHADPLVEICGCLLMRKNQTEQKEKNGRHGLRFLALSLFLVQASSL